MKNLLLLFLLFGAATVLSAQNYQKTAYWEFGILNQFSYGYLSTERSDWDALGIAESFTDQRTQNGVGFGLGVLAQWNISTRFALVPQSILTFQNNRIVFDLQNGSSVTATVRPVSITFPIHLIYTYAEWGRWHPSLLLGTRYTFGLLSAESANRIRVKPVSVGIDLGTGVAIHFRKFSFKPELLFSWGLNSLDESDSGVFNIAFDKIHQHQLALRFIVYGPKKNKKSSNRKKLLEDLE